MKLNKKSSRIVSLLTLLSATTLSSASVYTHQLGPNTGVSASSSSTAFLGAAFATDRNKIWPSTCLRGTSIVDSPGNTSQIISLNSEYNHQKLEENIDISVNGKANLFDLMKLGSEQSFKRAVSETETSYTLLLTYRYDAPVVRYQLADIGSRLTEFGQKALANGADSFYRLCGDSFISQFERGGRLFVGIKLDFANKSIKEVFKSSTNFKFADLASVKAALNGTRNKFSSLVNIYLTAYQIGGDQLALGNILGVVSGDNIKACYSSTSSNYQCGTIIDSLSKYVRNDGPLLKSWQRHPAVTGIITTHYRDVIEGNPQYTSELTKNIINSRSLLYKAFKDQQKLMSRIETVLSTSYSPLLQARWNKLEDDYLAAKSVVTSNIEALEYAMSVCYSALDSCNSSRINTLANLGNVRLPVDPYSLIDVGKISVGKGGGEQYCRAPELSIIVGVGARVKNDNIKSIKIGYRKLLNDGSLGSVQYKQCGSGSEKFVEAPAGHVLTGFEFRVRRDDVAAINVLSKKWDRSKRKLTGKIVSTRSGSGSELSLDLSTDQVNNTFYNTDHVVLTGLSLRASSDDASGITGTVGWIY
ncbi:hypothetical protein [Zooshikella ganghwensis]|uniref:hypothetical protein n=1 Tax=Zooshikella ganghwensis TaxID=202772 RepID=UPI0004800246|nr:hypothetical protein [Zooshikella ganghwensis]